MVVRTLVCKDSVPFLFSVACRKIILFKVFVETREDFFKQFIHVSDSKRKIFQEAMTAWAFVSDRGLNLITYAESLALKSK